MKLSDTKFKEIFPFNNPRAGQKELIEKIKSKGVDPCGENGEYHTFVVDGPIFDYKIDIKYDKSKIEENYALSIM